MAGWLFIKDPIAVLDYGFDIEDWLDGDTIQSSYWVVDSGLTVASYGSYSTYFVAWFSGGTYGNRYDATGHVVTNGGRTNRWTLAISVENT